MNLQNTFKLSAVALAVSLSAAAYADTTVTDIDSVNIVVDNNDGSVGSFNVIKGITNPTTLITSDVNTSGGTVINTNTAINGNFNVNGGTSTILTAAPVTTGADLVIPTVNAAFANTTQPFSQNRDDTQDQTRSVDSQIIDQNKFQLNTSVQTGQQSWTTSQTASAQYDANGVIIPGSLTGPVLGATVDNGFTASSVNQIQDLVLGRNNATEDYQLSISKTDNGVTNSTTVNASGISTGQITLAGQDLATTLATEAATRAAADTQLQANIDTEAATRAAADTALNTRVDTEAATRAAADTQLQANIDTEAATRLAADTQLQANIDTEAATRAAADTALNTRVDTEAATRAAVDTQLQANIDTEAAARTAADTALNTRVDTEAATRAAADTQLQANIDTEAATRLAADTQLQANIDTEAATRAAADTALNTRVDTEAATRAAVDTQLQANIDTEAAARTAADTALNTRVDTETAARTAADTALNTRVDTETATRAAADVVLQDNINAEAATRTAADTALNTRVDTEAATRAAGLAAAATDRQAIRSEFANGDVATLASANAYTNTQVANVNSRVNQLNSRVDDVEKTSYRGIAIALAAQQQIPNIGAGQFAVFGGVGHYEGESAGALGIASVFADGRTSVSAAVGFAGGNEVGGRVGVSYVFGGK